MARYTGPVCRLCRREGAKLFLKGDRCFSAKCALSYPDSVSAGKKEVKRPRTPPGQHGQARQRKMSEYGAQLREKQKARRAYGLMEGQFKRTFVRASAMKGITGENLLQLLELRLDNVIYRSGIAASRAQARQFVLHGHVTVNGKKVDVPSYNVKADDVVAIAPKSKDIERFKIVREGVARVVPQWLSVNADALTINVTALPARDDIDLTLQENMIVEFYSR